MKKINIISILAATVAGAISTQAQSVTNSLAAPPAYPWVTTATAGLTLTRGNSDLLLFTAKIGTDKKTPINEYMGEIDAAYGENDNVRSADSLHGEGQYNHLFSEKFYGFANVDALNDEIQDIRYRVSLNPGAGYYLIKTTPTTFAVEAGPGIVMEKLGNVQSTYASMRAAEHLEHQINTAAKVWEKAEIVSQVNKPDNYYVNAEAGVATAISKKLSLQFTLDDSFVKDPAAGRKKNDVKLISGVAYTF